MAASQDTEVHRTMTDTLTAPAAAGSPTTTSWVLDPTHSSITFSGRQLMISTVRGRFGRFDATIVGRDDRPEDASVVVTVDAASVDTGFEARDQHLRSADFLDVERYPVITFSSTAIVRSGDDALRVEGELTLRGVTGPVSFAATLRGFVVGMSGARRAAFTADVTIDRRDWGITWNMPVGDDTVLVGTGITLTFELTLEEAGAAPDAAAA
jgi:polyisoprenoid-binding protein YceI